MRIRLLPGMLACLCTFSMIAQVVAQPGPGMQCPVCQVDYVSDEDLAEAISDFLDLEPADVIVTAGAGPNRFLVTLPDDRVLSVAPLGPLFRHQNMVQRRLLQTEQGGLHLRSQTRAELHLRSEFYREAELAGEMLRLGWTDFYWYQYGMEVESPEGVRYCFQADMEVSPEATQTEISVGLDDDGNLEVIHTDGIRQRLHACAHDFAQLRDAVRAQLQQQLVMQTDGTFALEVNGLQRRFRLAAELRWSNMLEQPAFVTEGNRVFWRYRDGWEQEIIPLD